MQNGGPSAVAKAMSEQKAHPTDSPFSSKRVPPDIRKPTKKPATEGKQVRHDIEMVGYYKS